MSKRRWTAWVGAGVLVALALSWPVASASGATSKPSAATLAFYRLPSELPRAKPGTVIRTTPYRAIKGARAWKVLYHSRALDGRDIAVSGVVVVPVGAAPKGGRVVVTWAHGTHGVADACAPSRLADWVPHLPAIHELIKRGYAVVATDYEGLGTAGVHPYLVGESEGRGVLDMVRAARNLRQVHASSRAFIYGHSQGGQGALFAGELAPTYAPELQILGIVAGAPVTEITAMLPVAATLPETLGYVVMGLTGMEAAYPTVKVSDVLTPSALASAAKVVPTKCFEDVVKAFHEPVANVIAQNPADVPAIADVMAKETAGSVRSPAPIFLFQGLADTTVYKVFTDMYVKQACSVGDTVEYKTYGGVGHYHEVDASKADVLAWMTDRLNGQAAPTSC
jgi:pimeloyl-ACP methyl ester carboxylesterase